jgi:hypothetical protein
MKKSGCVLLALFFLMTVGPVAHASKQTEQATLQDVQPTNYAVEKKKHQQYDFTVFTAGKSYSCRTPDNKTINATDFVVGSTITFISNGKNGEIKTQQGKSAKCLITRVADAPAQAPAQ